MRAIGYLLLLCLVGLLTGCATGNRLAIPEGYELAEKHEMKVYADRGWQKSGYSIRDGDYVDIDAEGRWNAGGGYVSADGSTFWTCLWGLVPPFQIFFLFQPKTFAKQHSLIGEFRNGHRAKVGRQYSIDNQDGYYSGDLYFVCNDGSEANNSGFLDVTIEVYRPKYLVTEKPPDQSTEQATNPKTTHPPLSSPASTRFAVIIGVSNYKDARIPTLRYAAKDAKGFYDWCVSPLGGKYAPANVKLLLNEQATCKNIKNALFNWLKRALKEDMVTIYFAGHGSPESPDEAKNLFLLPYDAQYDNVAATGFPMWDIETALKRFIKAKKVVVIADACHSGGVGESFDIARRANRGMKVVPVNTGLHDLTKVSEGVCVISASDDKQMSRESEDWGGGHGVFTFYLLEGLTGDADYSKDAKVTLGELIPYLSEKVRRATKSAQSPTVSGKFYPALTIGR